MWSIEPIPAHQPLWLPLQHAIAQQALPQAMLLITPIAEHALSFAYRIMAECLCEETVKPCGLCPSCVMLKENIHPDIHVIQAEGPSHSIKIDMIRDVQLNIYQAPQRARYRFVLVNPANALNRAAANALLKIVEEPPAHAVYLFITDHLENIPATLISRCQRYIFPSSSSEDVIIPEVITQGLVAVRQGRMDVCSQAQAWDGYALHDLLHWLYYVTAKSIRECPSIPLFIQLDHINNAKQQISQIPALNKTLLIEQLLLHYARSYA
jgi:DNA polymerase-3 subunit delta'